MDTVHLLAALASALLHAAWNAAVKAHPLPRQAMAAQMAASALLALPVLAWAGLPPPAAWPWVALTTTINVLAVSALLKAYDSGGFGTVYPVMRATGVLGVAAVAPLLFGERLSAAGLLGVALIAAALGLLALDTRHQAATGFNRRAFAWTLLAGALTACYVLADAQGVRRSGSAWSYGCTVAVSNSVAMSLYHRADGAPWTLVRRHAALAWPAAAASMASYLLILWVFRHAPVAPAAALRDTSAVFAMLIAVLWLKEPLHPRRVGVLALALAGVPLLRLG